MRSTSLLLYAMFLCATTAFGQESYEYIIKTSTSFTNNSTDIPALIQKNSSSHLQIKRTSPIGISTNLFLFQVDKPLSDIQIHNLNQSNQILGCYPNLKVSTRNTTPNDEFYSDQWNLAQIGAPQLWSVMTGGTNSQGKKIVVAVIDTDFDINHEDLLDNIFINEGEIPDNGIDDDENNFIDDFRGFDFNNESPTIIAEGSGHGTKVASVLGAIGNNEMGITGLNWEVSILPLRISFLDEYINAQYYVKALRDKYNESNGEEGAFVVAINASLGFTDIPQALIDEVSNTYDDLGSSGILNVGSVPNSNVNIDIDPDITSAESDYLIAVTNTSFTDIKTTNAAYGLQNCDLGAPGGDNIRPILTLDNFNTIADNTGGTSFASPLVAGTIALLYDQESTYLDDETAEDPSGTALLLKDIILNSVLPLESLEGKSTSGGRLDAFQSLLNLHQHFQVNTLESGEDYIQELKIIKIFPSPSIASQEIKIIFAQDGFEALDYIIYEASGKTCKTGTIPVVPLTENQSMITIQNRLSSGVYFLKLFNAEMSVVTKIMII